MPHPIPKDVRNEYASCRPKQFHGLQIYISEFNVKILKKNYAVNHPGSF